MRQIILDTETTGLETSEGHRIIEIGCIEMVNRRRTGQHFHEYLQPDRKIDEGAAQVHGISDQFLRDKPRFTEVAGRFVAFIQDAELIIHNAPFDVGFLDYELGLLGEGWQKISTYVQIFDSLVLARKKHPGQKNSLDALCKRYEIDNSKRKLHGALLDAEILADVYLAMTGGQISLILEGGEDTTFTAEPIRRLPASRSSLPIFRANDQELGEHTKRLQAIRTTAGRCVWDSLKDR